MPSYGVRQKTMLCPYRVRVRVNMKHWGNANSEISIENPVESINLAWAMTPDQSNLRELMISVVCHNIGDITKPPFDNMLDPDFVKKAYNNLAKWYKDAKKDLEDMRIPKYDWNICEFHKHDAGCPKDLDFPRYT